MLVRGEGLICRNGELEVLQLRRGILEDRNFFALLDGSQLQLLVGGQSIVDLAKLMVHRERLCLGLPHDLRVRGPKRVVHLCLALSHRDRLTH